MHRSQGQEFIHLTQERTHRSSESAAAAKSEDQGRETESEKNDDLKKEENEGATKEKNKELTNEKAVESGDEKVRDNPSADLTHEKRDQHDLANTECHTVSKEIKTPVEE